jgi:hypothetical protein
MHLKKVTPPQDWPRMHESSFPSPGLFPCIFSSAADEPREKIAIHKLSERRFVFDINFKS